jgi:2-iminobutanoate/2-iminopropanoate deaminase
LDPVSGQIVSGDVVEQTKKVMANLHAVLTEAGCGWSSVVKSTIFLTDLGNFQTVNTIYGDALSGHKPARSTFQVSALPLGAIVEIEMIALDRA